MATNFSATESIKLEIERILQIIMPSADHIPSFTFRGLFRQKLRRQTFGWPFCAWNFLL